MQCEFDSVRGAYRDARGNPVPAEKLRRAVDRMCSGLRDALLGGEHSLVARKFADACFTAAVVGGGPAAWRTDWEPEVARPVREGLDRLSRVDFSDETNVEASYGRLAALASWPRAIFEQSLRAAARQSGARFERRVYSPGCRAGCRAAAEMGWQPIGTLPKVEFSGCRCEFDFALFPSAGSDPDNLVEQDVPESADVSPVASDFGFSSPRAIGSLTEAIRVGQISSMSQLAEVLLMARAICSRLLEDPSEEAAAVEEAIGYGSLSSLRQAVLTSESVAPADVSRKRLILDLCLAARTARDVVMETRFPRSHFATEQACRDWCDAHGVGYQAICEQPDAFVAPQKLAATSLGRPRAVALDGVTLLVVPVGTATLDAEFARSSTSRTRKAKEEATSEKEKKPRARRGAKVKGDPEDEAARQAGGHEATASPAGQYQDPGDSFWITTKDGRHVKVCKHPDDANKLLLLSGRYAGHSMEEAARMAEWDSELSRGESERDRARQELMEIQGRKKGVHIPDEQVIDYLLDKDKYLEKMEKELQTKSNILDHMLDKLEDPDESSDPKVKEEWKKWVSAVADPSRLTQDMKSQLPQVEEESRRAAAEVSDPLFLRSIKTISRLLGSASYAAWNYADAALLGGKSGLGGSSIAAGVAVPIPGIGPLPIPAVVFTELIKLGGKTGIPGLTHAAKAVRYVEEGVTRIDKWLDQKCGKVGARVVRAAGFYGSLGLAFGVGGVAGWMTALPAFGLGLTIGLAVIGKGVHLAGKKTGQGLSHVLTAVKTKLERVKAARAARAKAKAEASEQQAQQTRDHEETARNIEEARKTTHEASYFTDEKSLTAEEFTALAKETSVKYLRLIMEATKKHSRDLATLAALCTNKGKRTVNFSDAWCRFEPPFCVEGMPLVAFADRPACASAVAAAFAEFDAPAQAAASFFAASDVMLLDPPENGYWILNQAPCQMLDSRVWAGPLSLLRHLHADGLALDVQPVSFTDDAAAEVVSGEVATPSIDAATVAFATAIADCSSGVRDRLAAMLADASLRIATAMRTQERAVEVRVPRWAGATRPVSSVLAAIPFLAKRPDGASPGHVNAAAASFYQAVGDDHLLMDELVGLNASAAEQLRQIIPVCFASAGPQPVGMNQTDDDRARDLACLSEEANEAASLAAQRARDCPTSRLWQHALERAEKARDAFCSAYGDRQARAIFGSAVSLYAVHPSPMVPAMAIVYMSQNWPEMEEDVRHPSAFLRSLGDRLASHLIASWQGSSPDTELAEFLEQPFELPVTSSERNAAFRSSQEQHSRLETARIDPEAALAFCRTAGVAADDGFARTGDPAQATFSADIAASGLAARLTDVQGRRCFCTKTRLSESGFTEEVCFVDGKPQAVQYRVYTPERLAVHRRLAAECVQEQMTAGSSKKASILWGQPAGLADPDGAVNLCPHAAADRLCRASGSDQPAYFVDEGADLARGALFDASLETAAPLEWRSVPSDTIEDVTAVIERLASVGYEVNLAVFSQEKLPHAAFKRLQAHPDVVESEFWTTDDGRLYCRVVPQSDSGEPVCLNIS